mgnify:CR=1 FL=1
MHTQKMTSLFRMMITFVVTSIILATAYCGVKALLPDTTRPVHTITITQPDGRTDTINMTMDEYRAYRQSCSDALGAARYEEKHGGK